MLLSGFTREQLKATIVPGGRYVQLELCYPETFLAPNRLELASGNVSMDRHKATALRKEVGKLREAFNFEDVKSTYRIKLPIKCDEDFYADDDAATGVEVVMYQHEKEDYRAGSQHYYMLHLELMGANKSGKPPARVTDGNFRLVGSPVQR